jgi:hypothetical protein
MLTTKTTGSDRSLGCWAKSYWLEHCEEFSVESPAGRLGYVTAVDPTHGELVVIGDDGVTRVPFREIHFIDSQNERVAVTTPKEGAR